MTLDTRYSGKELSSAVLGLTTVLCTLFPPFDYFALFLQALRVYLRYGGTNVNPGGSADLLRASLDFGTTRVEIGLPALILQITSNLEKIS